MTSLSWDELLPGLRDRLIRRARRLGVDSEAAEDLAQQALYEAWRLRSRIYDPAGVDRWVFVILGNLCVSDG
jgi:DNA-directed RNA polymerase specialized sigma24 family protein